MGPQLIFIEVSLRFDEMDESYNMSIKLSITLTTFLKLLKMSRAGDLFPHSMEILQRQYV